MERYISFSGGVESTTMCILYGADAKGIWADTGSEHKKMYERIETVEKQIKKIHPDFEIIKVKGSAKHKGEWYDSLEDLANNFLDLVHPEAYLKKINHVTPLYKKIISKLLILKN